MLESHLLKMPKTVASLALIVELVEGGRGLVGTLATARALDWADYLQSHANCLYAAGSIAAEDGAKLVIERRHQLPNRFTSRDLQMKSWAGLSDKDAVAAALDLLVEHFYCREVAVPTSPAGGRPTSTCVWNPVLASEAR